MGSQGHLKLGRDISFLQSIISVHTEMLFTIDPVLFFLMSLSMGAWVAESSGVRARPLRLLLARTTLIPTVWWEVCPQPLSCKENRERKKKEKSLQMKMMLDYWAQKQSFLRAEQSPVSQVRSEVIRRLAADLPITNISLFWSQKIPGIASSKCKSDTEWDRPLRVGGPPYLEF